MHEDIHLRSDCSQCAALCCVAPPFDQSPEFGYSKAANVPCRHLQADNGCAIHARRAAEGFRGCIAYECNGAGQYVTQKLFGGRSWREDASLMAPMAQAFFAMRQVCELLVLLRQARSAPLPDDAQQAMSGLVDELAPAEGWTCATLEAFRESDLEARVRRFLVSLAPHFRDARQDGFRSH